MAEGNAMRPERCAGKGWENSIKMHRFCVQYTEMVAHLDTMGKKAGKLKGTDKRNG
jgi:hypothetical protein